MRKNRAPRWVKAPLVLVFMFCAVSIPIIFVCIIWADDASRLMLVKVFATACCVLVCCMVGLWMVTQWEDTYS